MPQRLRLIDLFAGAGGMTQGFKSTRRYRTVVAVELDKYAAATFAQNHNAARVFAGGIEEWLDEGLVPQADVIIGGPPCQGFSGLGKQDVLDERNFLWRKYAETIIRARPKYFVVENVRQFLTSPQFAEFESWTSPGEPLQDYELQPLLLNAADFGAYQARTRTIVIGRRRGLAEIPVPAVGPFKGQHRSVEDAFVGMPNQRVIPRMTSVRDFPDTRTEVRGMTMPGPFTTPELHVTRNYTDRSLERFRTIPAGGNRFDIPDELLADCWRKHKSGSGDVMGRLHWNKPSVTIRTEFFKPEKGRYLHPDPDVHRAITHFEAARLQGFPDDYKWMGSKTAIAKQIGNAVPIQLAAFLGQLIAEAWDAALAEAGTVPSSRSDKAA
ncbi:DNA cytosine methyltransferase [Pseudarthrobacter sp. S6]|uniref:DNA cytosine methyltransferase n=1 Tax=Pseudarthrobacter sp. S6 TaxID=3418420 RepID=UPI003CEDB300